MEYLILLIHIIFCLIFGSLVLMSCKRINFYIVTLNYFDRFAFNSYTVQFNQLLFVYSVVDLLWPGFFNNYSDNIPRPFGSTKYIVNTSFHIQRHMRFGIDGELWISSICLIRLVMKKFTRKWLLNCLIIIICFLYSYYKK